MSELRGLICVLIMVLLTLIAAVFVAALLFARKIRSKVKRESKADLKKWYTDALDTIVAARLEKESTTEFGEAIFLSHNISQSQFGHWVLHTHGYKYELRREEVHHSNSQGGYAAVISLSGFDRNAYECALATTYTPQIGNYIFSMVGWTTLSKEQIDEECHRVWETFGNYDLFSNNCHDFLRRLADKIITTRAPDWNWFRQHTVPKHPYRLLPALDYQVISAATWIKHLERMKNYPRTTEQRRIDNLIMKLEQFIHANLDHLIVYLAANTGRMEHLTAEVPDTEMV